MDESKAGLPRTASDTLQALMGVFYGISLGYVLQLAFDAGNSAHELQVYAANYNLPATVLGFANDGLASVGGIVTGVVIGIPIYLLYVLLISKISGTKGAKAAYLGAPFFLIIFTPLSIFYWVIGATHSLPAADVSSIQLANLPVDAKVSVLNALNTVNNAEIVNTYFVLVQLVTVFLLVILLVLITVGVKASHKS